jgi:hypothetical protein
MIMSHKVNKKERYFSTAKLYVKEMTELVSGMPASQFWDESP